MANKSCLSVALQQQWACCKKCKCRSPSTKDCTLNLCRIIIISSGAEVILRGGELKCPRMLRDIIFNIRAHNPDKSGVWDMVTFVYLSLLLRLLFLPYITLFSLFSSRFAIGDKPNGKQLCPAAGPSSSFLFSGKKCTRRMSLKWRPPLPVGGIRGNMWTYLESKQEEMCKFSISMFMPQA